MALTDVGLSSKTRLEHAARELAPALALAPETLTQLARLLELVTLWNARVGLTSARDADQLVDLYLADALVLAREAAERERWVDVGSGGGAPGLALALLAPRIDLTLVEPREKRVAFLRSAVGALGVANVRVLRARSESLQEGAWDVATSRATLPPARWLAEGARLAERVWVLLAQAPPPELAGWSVERDVAYRWPLTGAPRRALRFARDAR